MPEPQVRIVRRFVGALEENLDGGRGLWLHGEVGTGKTTLAMLVSRAALDAGRSVAISLPRCRPRSARRPSPTATGPTSPSSIAGRGRPPARDDVGAEKTSEWVLEQLYAIVNARYEEERSIVLTTNLERDDLGAQIGERTVSRLEEMCTLVPLYGEDARKFVA
jgi:DNA replication protein DnaC